MTSVRHRDTIVSDQSWEEQNIFSSLKSYGFLLLLLATAGTLCLCCWEQTLASAFAFGIFGLTGCYLCRSSARISQNIFLIVYSLAVISTLLLFCLYNTRHGSPYQAGGSDDLSYEIDAAFTASTTSFWQFEAKSVSHEISLHNSPLYILLLSYFHRCAHYIDGFHTLIPRFFNSFILGLLSVVILKLSLKLTGSIFYSLYAALVSCCSPIMLYITGHTCRDIVVSFLITLLPFLWTSSKRQTSQPEITTTADHVSVFHLYVYTIIICLVIFYLRKPALMIPVGVILTSAYCKFRDVPMLRPLTIVTILFLCSAAVFYQSTIEHFLSLNSESVERYSQSRSLGSGLYAKLYGIPLFPFGLAARSLAGLFPPIPVPSREVDRLLISLGTCAIAPLVPFLLAGCYVCYKRTASWPTLVSFLIAFTGAAIFSGTTRHISMYFPLACVIGGVGLNKFPQYLRLSFACTCLMAAASVATYAILKQS